MSKCQTSQSSEGEESGSLGWEQPCKASTVQETASVTRCKVQTTMVTLRHLTKDLAKPGAMQGKAGVTARRQEKGRGECMCRMDFIQDAHEKGEKSDQPHVSKLPVSQLGWPSSDHQSPGHLLSCSLIFCGGVGIKDGALCAAPPLGAAVWECRCCSRCSLSSLAERVLGEHLHPWNECSASHPGL